MFWISLFLAAVVSSSAIISLNTAGIGRALIEWLVFLMCIEGPVVVGYVLVMHRLALR